MGFDCYLKIEGITGESKESNHIEWIEVLSFSHSIIGADTGRNRGVSHSEFSFVKLIDVSSPNLNSAASMNRLFKTATFEMFRQSGERKVKVYTIKLSNAAIKKVELGKSWAESAEPVEQIDLSYSQIEWTYVQQERADGGTGGSTNAAYDLTAKK